MLLVHPEGHHRSKQCGHFHQSVGYWCVWAWCWWQSCCWERRLLILHPHSTKTHHLLRRTGNCVPCHMIYSSQLFYTAGKNRRNIAQWFNLPPLRHMSYLIWMFYCSSLSGRECPVKMGLRWLDKDSCCCTVIIGFLQLSSNVQGKSDGLRTAIYVNTQHSHLYSMTLLYRCIQHHLYRMAGEFQKGSVKNYS